MLEILIFTIFIFVISMIVVANGIKRKEANKIECELSTFCELEKLRNCSANNSSQLSNGQNMVLDILQEKHNSLKR
jgi:hypothetical protein